MKLVSKSDNLSFSYEGWKGRADCTNVVNRINKAAARQSVSWRERQKERFATHFFVAKIVLCVEKKNKWIWTSIKRQTTELKTTTGGCCCCVTFQIELRNDVWLDQHFKLATSMNGQGRRGNSNNNNNNAHRNGSLGGNSSSSNGAAFSGVSANGNQNGSISAIATTSNWKLSKVFSDNDDALINRKLPKELLLRIFSHLDVVSLCRCAQVSKLWNILALDGSNWQRVDLFEFQIDIEGAIVENLARRCGGFLKKLSLRGCQAVGDSALATFAQHCNSIEGLNLQHCKKITDRTCQSLSLHCHKLQLLDLSSCSSVSDISLLALSKGCPNLTHIDISWCDLITGNGINALADGCHKLKSFIAKGCVHIHDDSLSHMARNCHDLQKVNIQGCRNVQDDGMTHLAENCLGLKYLCVSNCSHLTDLTLINLANNCHELTTLECAGVSQFTDTGFQALARNCPHLERMDLEECVLITDSTIAVLSACCPLLESLSLSHCELITDEGIRQLGIAPCASETLNVLELDNLPLITDASLDHLISCHNLKRIELYDCQLITRAGIRRLRSHLPNIKVHAYFAPVTPPPTQGGTRQRYCRCCVILWSKNFNSGSHLLLQIFNLRLLHDLALPFTASFVSVLGTADAHYDDDNDFLFLLRLWQETFFVFRDERIFL